MTSRSSLNASGYDVGDIKLRYAPFANAVESSVINFRSQEWLRTGYLVPYAVKYAAHLTMGIGRGLYAYDTVLEQLISVAGTNQKAQVTVDHYGGRYYFFPDYLGINAVQSKTVFDNNATSGTTSTVLPAGHNITEVRGFFVIKSGASAGRVFVSTNGDAGYKLMYQTGDLTGAWVDANLGSMAGGNPRLIAGKPDGSLLVVLADTLQSAYGAGNIKTSVNGGTVWASQTANLGSGTSVYEASWSATLNKFVMIASVASVPRYFTSADGYNWTQETGQTFGSLTFSSCLIADNGAATIVLGDALTLYRSVGGGAFAPVATARQLRAVCAAGSAFYALNSNGGVEMSTDNGTTWVVIGQINGPAVSPFTGGPGQSLHIKAANGNLFISSSTGFCRFSLQAMPTLTPDRVGAASAVATASGVTNAANYVRIL